MQHFFLMNSFSCLDCFYSLIVLHILWRRAWSFSNTKIGKPSQVQVASRLRILFQSRVSWNDDDEHFMLLAADFAAKGFGHTFPNPAVGCILVDGITGDIVGSGFHPRAGFPHAEVFALLEAAGHVTSGVTAAESVLTSEPNPLRNRVTELMNLYYSSEHGPSQLFKDCLSANPVTAFVTLEPCCHYGRTPPCAATLALAKVRRVVVGTRDPNPLVAGGGMKFLESTGVRVDMALGSKSMHACQKLVMNFVKRITDNSSESELEELLTGPTRHVVRSVVSRYVHEKKVLFIDWVGEQAVLDESTELAILEMPIQPLWLEQVDSTLWSHEIVGLRLNNAVSKRKFAKTLGERIGKLLKAKVVQSRGHTVVLYRPGVPPILNFTDSGLSP